MNVKERNKIIKSKFNLLGFAKSNGLDITNSIRYNPEEFNKYMRSLDRPPIQYYIPYQALQTLKYYTTSARYTNKVQEKFRLVNELMGIYGFKPLASGTNRRAFYCTYDPYIILKLGSDSIGRSDNIAEFKLQELLKPFCVRIIHVTPDGMLSMQERVEPMTSEDFAFKYGNDCIGMIIEMLKQGFIMEDVGSYFFKNYGVRLKFGPVLLDFPYIYKIDWSKTRCKKIDPLTGIECGGFIDYDYETGCNEIICTKCGARYSARYLADTNQDKYIQIATSKGRHTMLAGDTNLKVYITQGNKVIHKFYNEDNMQAVSDFQLPRSNVPLMDVATIIKTDNKEDKHPDTTGHIEDGQMYWKNGEQFFMYPKEVKNEIIKFLKHIEKIHGEEISKLLAKKMQVKYITTSEFEKSKLSNLDPKPASKESKEKEPAKEEKKEESKEEDSKPLPSDGLFPMKPMTQEEIDAKEMKERGTGAVMGFAGVPLVDTLRQKETTPIIKSMILDRFNNYIMNEENPDQFIHDLADQIKDFIHDDVQDMMKDDGKGIEVNIERVTDHLNRDCLKVNVEDYSSPILEVLLYPINDEELESELIETKKKEAQELIEDKEALNTFFETHAEEFDKGNTPDEEVKSKLSAYLVACLLDEYSGDELREIITVPKARNLVKEFIDSKFVDNTEDTRTVADEL